MRDGDSSPSPFSSLLVCFSHSLSPRGSFLRIQVSLPMCALSLMVKSKCLADTLEDRLIVKVGMFAEIRKNKLDFCLKSN